MIWDDVANAIQDGDFLLAVFMAIMAVLLNLLNLILFPFSLLIKTFLPELDAGLIALASYFEYASTYMAYVINAFAIPSTVLVIIGSYYLFAYTVTFVAWSVKLVIQWKAALWG